MATFRGTTGTDTFIGFVNVADNFQFLVSELNAGDTVFGNGGSGTDKITLLDAGTVNFGTLPSLAGIESYVLAAAGNSVTFVDSNGIDGAISVTAGTGNDTINASALSATMKVSATLGTGTDTATGGAAADTFRITAAGLTAADTINGGGNNDTLFFTTAASILSSAVFAGLTSIEQFSLAAGTNTITLSDALVNATDKDSLIVSGGTGNDTVDASTVLAGRTTILRAGGGNDTLTGGAGVDVLETTAAQLTSGDVMNGGAGTIDRVDVTAAGTVGLSAFAGISNVEQVKLKVGGITLNVDNALAAIAGGTRVAVGGSKANDIVNASTFSAGTVSVALSTGTDTVTGPAAGGTLTVQVRPTELTAADILTGGAGIAELSFLAAGTITTAQLAGVTGFGLFTLSSAGNSLTLNDTVVTANDRSVTLATFGETLFGLQVEGAGGVDRIDATALTGANALLVNNAGAGDDILRGGAGSDRLNGGSGDDSLFGGAGDDVYAVDSAGDTVVESLGGGTDLVRATASHVLAANVENLTLIGGGAINGTGNELANVIIGNGGANVLDGAGGDDILRASLGDTVIGGSGIDALSPGAVASFNLLTTPAGISGLEVIDLTGNGATALSLTATAGAGFTAGQIRIKGEAGDTLVTDAGWADFGEVMIDGQSVQRFTKGSTILYVDAAIAGVNANAPVFGTTVSGRQVIDLTSLSAAQGFIIQGDTMGDFAGNSAADAGDINGDGFDDLIVGALFGGDGGTYAGEAYVVFGAAGGFGSAVGGRQVIDLTTLSAAQGFIIQGDLAGDVAGAGVAAAGDVNGDGFDDLIVGASAGDDGGGNAGEAYVVFGAAGGFGSAVGGRQVIDLTSFSAAQGFIIQGDTANDYAGHGVSAAGDVNGDGLGDLIVGAHGGDDGGSESGEAYVVFGSTGGFGTLVGGRQVVDLTSLSAAQGFIIQGDTPGDFAGYSVSAAGDVNGDGLGDLVVGAYSGDDGGSNASEAYVVFGTNAGFGGTVGGRQVIDLTSLSAAQGFIIQGDTMDDHAGVSVSTTGDINGDGFADIIVGASGGSDGGNYAGEAYVVFGSNAGFGSAVGGRQVIDLTSLSAAQGFIIQGDATGDKAGGSVAAAGDINGDGFDDMIIGADLGDDGGSAAGEAYVVFGTDTGFGTAVGGRQVTDLTNLTAAQGFIIQGDMAGDYAGRVAGAGDLNSDGFDDLIVGARCGDDGGPNAGEAYVVFGGPAGFNLPQLAGTEGDDILTGSALAERLVGGRGDDTLIGGGGADVFNGGAGDDVIDVGSVSFARIDGGTGHDTLLLGGSLNLTTLGDSLITGIDQVTLAGGAVLTLDPGEIRALGDHGTLVVAGSGSLLAAGTWEEAGTVAMGGEQFIRLARGGTELLVGDGVDRSGIALTPAFGGAVGGRQVIDLTNLAAAQGFIIQGDTAGDIAGLSVSDAGDVNGDGFGDFVVAAAYGGDGGTKAGEAYVVFGAGGGFGSAIGGRQVIDLTSLSAAQGFIIQGDTAYDFAGASVSATGDVNGDGFGDLVVGAMAGTMAGTMPARPMWYLAPAAASVVRWAAVR
ncbi:hypothetical protein D3874_19385 [Oleomonas cavernae]|uniref:Calcium-binding protein n=1 Tax=Oleomonas cavernae TaxID=2320859 RepID=A0A418WFW3_9PROT|nr:FG-GAP repeat protein [Oleomonas cavernae]RJF88872.1 hypothetical protein D3874_19385 [Oleomonas cavernae]